MQILIVCASLLVVGLAYPGGGVEYDVSSYGSSGHDDGDFGDDIGEGAGPAAAVKSAPVKYSSSAQTKYASDAGAGAKYVSNGAEAKYYSDGAEAKYISEGAGTKYVSDGADTKYYSQGAGAGAGRAAYVEQTKYVEAAPVKYAAAAVPSYGSSGHASSYSTFARESHPIEVTKGESRYPSEGHEDDHDDVEDDGPVYEKSYGGSGHGDY